MIPGSGRSPGRGCGNPLQYPCLENSMDRGDWWAIVQRRKVRHLGCKILQGREKNSFDPPDGSPSPGLFLKLDASALNNLAYFSGINFISCCILLSLANSPHRHSAQVTHLAVAGGAPATSISLPTVSFAYLIHPVTRIYT